MDILLADKGDGGEVVLQIPLIESGGGYTTENGDPVPDTGIGTAVYTSLFTDAHWSDLIKGDENQVPSAGSFEGLLSLPITVGTVQNLQSAASRQLSWLKRDGVVGELSVEVSNPAVGRILVDIYTTRPNDAESRYQILWDQQEQKIIEVKRNG